MNNIYLEINIFIQPDEYLRDLIIAQLTDINFLGFKETENGIQCYIQKELWTNENIETLNEILKLNNLDINQSIEIIELEEQNWNKTWENSLKPIEVGKNFVITQSWNDVQNSPKIKLIIDPKMSFGTGFHETTRLMIEQMENINFLNKSVLDIGTGTGILSFVAEKLSAKRILGIDIDSWSFENVLENKEKNNLQNCEFKLATLDKLEDEKFDIILANITKNTIIDLSNIFNNFLKQKGQLIISGFFENEIDEITTSLNKSAFSIKYLSKENQWASALFELK